MDITKAHEIFDKYKPQFDSLGAIICSQSPAEDLLLLRWWIHLAETGDINRLVFPESRRLSPFLNIFKYPTVLIYSLSPAGEMDNAFWTTPVDGESKHRAAYCAFWTHPDIRGSRRQVNFGAFVHTFTFEFYDALLAMVFQPNLLDLYQKVGYSIVGCIPKIYDEDFLYIMHLTREAFDSSRLVQVIRR